MPKFFSKNSRKHVKERFKKIDFLKSPHPDNILVSVFKLLAKKIKALTVTFCMGYWKDCGVLLETSC